jgi:hypothetical protein
MTVGGNLTLTAPLIILEGSQIVANAFEGMGGHIRLDASMFLRDPVSVVSASSDRGVQGTVAIQAPVTTLIGTLAPLPQTFVNIVALLPARCAARAPGGTTSSLVLGGRDGLPPEPAQVLPTTPMPAERLTTDPALVGGPEPNQRTRGALLTMAEQALPRLQAQRPPAEGFSAWLVRCPQYRQEASD